MRTFVSYSDIAGLLVGIPYIAYSSGILLVYALGSLLHWRMAAWCGLLLPICSFMALILVAPESPTWLARKGYYDKARKGKKCVLGKREPNFGSHKVAVIIIPGT